ncbi:MAG: hypothetical protein KF799_09885 [Bdellovibrionales bacterium]|nr:hypothetical protein [Bdellovibrionales bacterium]
MSSLSRYKKSGGFYQLLSLIETFGPQKKEKFMEMIEAESAAWAQALRDKMLTLERIFTWPDEVIIEIFKEMQPKSLAFALEGLKEEQKARITKFLSHAEQRRLTDVLTESKPKPEEISSTLVKVVETARRMIHERQLHVEKFDQKLLIPEDLEARLEEQGSGSSSGHSSAAVNDAVAAVAAATADPGKAPTLEVAQLQRTLALMLKENKALKEEVRGLRDKLDQIKKFAA